MEETRNRDWILLGIAIAVVEVKLTTDESILTKIKDSRIKALVDQLETIYLTLQASSHSDLTLSTKPCSAKRPMLEYDLGVLVHHALIAPRLKTLPPSVSTLFEHVNNCYWCFEIYGQVFKGYHYGRQQFSPPKSDF